MSTSLASLLFPSTRLAPGERAAPGQSYMASSFELRAGLEVRVLSLGQLPADVLRELQRLHLIWRAARPG
jgi:hypothetical protein